MEKELGRIVVRKDTMLFVIETLTGTEIPSKTTKEKILESLPEIYNEADSMDIIKMLPYDAYVLLEKIIKIVKENKKGNEDEIIEITDLMDKVKLTGSEMIFFLENFNLLTDPMIVVPRIKKTDYRVFVDTKLLKVLEKIYTAENRKIAEKYGRLEKIIIGIFETYGVIEEKTYYKFINSAYGKNVKKSLIEELEDVRLSLNGKNFINEIEWIGYDTDVFRTKYNTDYEEEEVFDEISKHQKYLELDYKEYSAEEYIDKANQKFNKFDLDFIEFLEKYRKDCKYIVYHMKRLVEAGNEKTFARLESDFLDVFNPDQEAVDQYTIWYNNTPQYALCGYSPNELSEKYYNN